MTRPLTLHTIAVGAVFALALVALVPQTALAGQAHGFSFWPATLSAEAASFPKVPSAATPALAPARNVDPSGRGGGDITVEDGVALKAEVGPSGTAADVVRAKPKADQISIYVVRNGDTISQIAEMFGVTPNTIMWANDLNRGNVIHAGDTLVILPVTGVEHTVKKGETLASIVKKYKGDLAEVMEFNNLSSATVAVGDTIIIPDGVEAAAPSGSITSPFRGGGGPALVGYFLRPIVGGAKTQGIHGYNGIDIGASVGTNVLASAGGTVLVSRGSGWNGGYGNYIVIQHSNGTQTLYAHLSQNYISQGQSVVQGQVIGAVGRTGKATGPHLHFEVRGAANPF